MHRFTTIAVALCLAVAAGSAAQGKTQKISKKLVDRAKDTTKEIEKVGKQLDKTMKQQQKLLSKTKVKDRQKEHKKLQEELEKTEKAVADLRKKGAAMEKEAEKFFTEWNKGIAEVGDAELRALSEESYDASRSQYGQIIGTGNLAAKQYADFVGSLRNELSFLDLDLSDRAIEQLRPKTQKTSQQARELGSSVDELTRKIDAYIRDLR